MPELPSMLLMDPQTLLRQTVSLTLRSLNIAQVHEATSLAMARSLLETLRFQGAVMALDTDDAQGCAAGLSLIAYIRMGLSKSYALMPIAVMVDHCTEETLAALRQSGVTRVIVRPLRARALIDAFADFSAPAARSIS